MSLIVGDKKVVVMLFNEASFRGFVGQAIANTSQGSEVLISLGANSREEVDEIARKAETAGGVVFGKPGGTGCMAVVLPILTATAGTSSTWT